VTLPSFQTVPPQPQAQQAQPRLTGTPPPPFPGWVRVSRTVISPASATTAPGDILVPSGYAHAMILWIARDTSGNATGSFGGMQMGCNGAPVDTAAHYNWTEVLAGVATAPVNGGIAGGLNLDPIVTAGGGSAAGSWNRGTIMIPFYSVVGVNVTCHWQIAHTNPGAPFTRMGTGEFFGTPGPLTTIRFISGAANFAVGTSFDLLVCQ